jgi:8-oxo-dGTP pyrophosphatase MutT (NUDIX family)
MDPHPTPSRQAWSVAVYPRFQGRALLILHRRLGVWLPPGGECEPDETPLMAARRELFEETGLVGTFPTLTDVDGTPPGLLGYEEHQAGSKGLHKNFVFVVDVDTDEVRPNAEFTEWRWVDSAAGLRAPKNVGQFLDLALSAGRGGRSASPSGGPGGPAGARSRPARRR